MTYGLGWIPDSKKTPGQKQDYNAEVVLYQASDLPSAVSNRDLIVSILNQGRLGSCTANAAMQAVRGSHIKQGAVNPPLGSRLFPYYGARASIGQTAVDSGASLRDLFWNLAHFGFCREDIWPYSDDTSAGALFARMPSSNAFRMAYDQSAVYRKILTGGAELVLDLKRALAARYLVVFGTLVGDTFVSNPGDKPISPPNQDTILGGHALAVDGYDEGDNFDIVNSWGPEFNGDGHIQFTADYLTWQSSGDFWIVDAAPIFS